jgi:hypothetical protein
MQPANRQYLEDNRRFYTAWVNDKVLYSLDAAVKQNIQRIINEEWQPGYSADLYCGHCVAKMLELAYGKMDEESTQAAPNMVDVVRLKLNE